MFFKRLSRSRSNSQSYIDNYSPQDSKAPSASYDDKFRDDVYDQRPDSSRGLNSSSNKDNTMFAAQNQDQYATPPVSSSGNRSGMNGYSGFGSGSNPAISKAPVSAEPMPDLLTRAFNEAIRPYSAKLEEMEGDIADMRAHIEQLEAQRREVHAWIDKRGLRPGKCNSFLFRSSSTGSCRLLSGFKCRDQASTELGLTRLPQMCHRVLPSKWMLFLHTIPPTPPPLSMHNSIARSP